MKRLTLIFLLMTSSAWSQTFTTDYWPLDSSASWDAGGEFSTPSVTMGNPRFNVAAMAGAKDVAFYMSGYPSSNRVWRYSKNLDSTVGPWHSTVNGAVAWDYLNHGHISTTNDFDTAIIGKTSTNGRYLRGYSLNGSNVFAQNWSYTWPQIGDAAWFVATAIQIGNRDGSNDTMIAIGRGGNPEHPKYAISTDGGRTFGDTIRVPSNASPFSLTNFRDGDGRIGGLYYNGTAAIIYNYQRYGGIDSATTVWWEWDRANQEWDDMGHPLDRSGLGYNSTTTWFRSFAANAIGTKRFVVHGVNNRGGVDSVLYAYRDAGDGDWTRGGFAVCAVQTATVNFQYMALTYIQSTGRLVLFYTKDNSTSSMDRTLCMRWWDNTANTWSNEAVVSRLSHCLNVSTPQIVPTSHGDVAYFMYSGMSSRNGSNYYYMEAARVTFTTTSSTINITPSTPLPYTCASSNTTYNITGNLTATGDGIYIGDGVNNIVIEGNNYTLSFGTAGTTYPTIATTGPYGIRTSSGTPSYNVTIRNLKVWHSPPTAVDGTPGPIWTDPTLLSRALAFRWAAGGTHDYRIENCDFKVIGRNTWIMYADNSSPVVGRGHYNNDMVNCVWRDSMAAFIRRDYWDEQTMINLKNNNVGKSRNSDMEYHWKFEGCSTAVAFWSNVHLEGDSTVAIFDNNRWFTDGWNRLNGTAIAHPTMTTATENYGIALRQADDARAEGVRIKINNNRFDVGTEHSGGRGIFVAGVEGINYNFEDSCISITNNLIRVHQGFDGYATTVKGIIFRERFGAARVLNNTIDMPLYYGSAPGPSYGPGWASGIEITANPGYELLVKGNKISVYFVGAFTPPSLHSDPGAYPISFVETWMDSIPSATISSVVCKYNYTHSIKVDSNRLITNHVFFRYGASNGPAGDPQTIGDTLEYYGGTSPNNTTTFAVMKQYSDDQSYTPAGASASDSTFLQDMVIVNGVDETRFSMSETEPRRMSMGAKATMTVTVRNSSNALVSGATVTITDRYGLTKASGTTNGSGIYSATLPYYQQFGGTIGTTPDSTYNPYVVGASYPAAGSTSSNLTLTASNKTLTLYLGSTPETPAEPRTKITGGVHISGGVIIP